MRYAMTDREPEQQECICRALVQGECKASEHDYDPITESPKHEDDYHHRLLYTDADMDRVENNRNAAVAERDEANQRSHQSWEAARRAKAERDALRAVFDAAKWWRMNQPNPINGTRISHERRLREAVDTYLKENPHER